MYFLINTIDDSVNFNSPDPIPDWMMVAYPVYRAEVPDNELPEGVDLHYCYYNKENNSIYPSPMGLTRLSAKELQEFIDQAQLTQQAVSQQDTDKYNKLVEFLAKVYPDDPAIQAILADNTVTTDELQTIENMLNNSGLTK